LNRLGFLTEIVPGGTEALEAWARTPFDLILLDCQMPGMDGYQTAREIRARENGGGRTPIIALTANAGDSEPEKCLASGMDSYLTKPIRLTALETTLDRWIPRNRPALPPVALEQAPHH
jgi:CheY-like chemotaxis protein